MERLVTGITRVHFPHGPGQLLGLLAFAHLDEVDNVVSRFHKALHCRDQWDGMS